MCLEDIRIQRKTTAGEKTVALNQTPIILVDYSPDRTALVLGAPATEDVILSFGEQPSATNGIRINGGGNPLCLTLLMHGDMVRKRIWAICVANTESIGVWESSYFDEGARR